MIKLLKKIKMKNYKILLILIFILLINNLNNIIFLKIIKFYTFNRIRKYLNKCLLVFNSNGKIILNYQNPKISVIIPVYNSENSIILSINSIRNQKLKDFEIILINDNSKDNSKKVIENLQKEDSKIFVINNNKNMGTLYSRSIGVLASKGEYIFALDNDDMFADENLFYRLYQEAKKYNYDIIGFKSIIGYNYYSNISEMNEDPFINKKADMVVYQPELRIFSLINNDCHIWGKCIKRNVYKKAINDLGKERYSIYLCYSEDDVMVFILFKIAKSFKFTNKYGIFHIKSNKTASSYLSRNHLLFSKIFFLDVVFDFSENKFTEKEFVVSYAINIIMIFLSKIVLNNENKEYLKLVLRKIISSDFISKNKKETLINNFKNYSLYIQ